MTKSSSASFGLAILMLCVGIIITKDPQMRVILTALDTYLALIVLSDAIQMHTWRIIPRIINIGCLAMGIISIIASGWLYQPAVLVGGTIAFIGGLNLGKAAERPTQGAHDARAA